MQDSEEVKGPVGPGHAHSNVRQIAMVSLKGPRAVMLPEDPRGMRFWLVPTLQMTVSGMPPHEVTTLSLYVVPNVIEHDWNSLVLVRHASWDSQLTRQLCRANPSAWPTIAANNTPVVTYMPVPADQVRALDALVIEVEKAMSSIHIREEGLDLGGPSGLKPLPENARIVRDSLRCQLRRHMRFMFVELHWHAGESQLDKCWRLLWDALFNITTSPKPESLPRYIEKYDIDPNAYAKFLIGLQQ